MNLNHFDPNDPRLTAYALGEMNADERASFEAEIKSHPEAQVEIAAIRETVGQLTTLLEQEPMSASVSAAYAENPVRLKKVIRFPYYLIALAAAACFALIVWWRVEPHAEEKRQNPGPRMASARVELPAVVAEPLLDTGKDEKPPQAAAFSVPEEPALLVDVPPTTASASMTEGTAPSKPSELLKSLDSVAEIPVRRSVPLKATLGFDKSLEKDPGSMPTTVAASPLIVGTDSTSTGATDRIKPASPVKDRDVVDYSPDANPAGDRESSSAIKPSSAAFGFDHALVDTPRKITVISGGLPTGNSSADLNAENEAGAKSIAGYTRSVAESVRAFEGGPLSEAHQKRRADYLEQRSNFVKSPQTSEAYDSIAENGFIAVADQPLSTFSADVDTASYANIRRLLMIDKLPPRDAVRIEEMVNYFPYNYAAPKDGRPFSAKMEVAAAPWAPEHRLVRIGLKAKDVSTQERAAANIVFLLDTSGSMDAYNRLPLAVKGMKLLLEKLKPEDRVAIVTYAGESGLALPSTLVKNKPEILEVLNRLNANGSTNGGLGIILAYDIAKANFIKGGINRVILCTDGDFNVGVTSRDALEQLITEKAKSGVFLTALGFGMGNYQDATIRMLADKGNGNYGYIDSEAEARKLLVDQVSGTLVAVAKDVKFQVEFNPQRVSSYRLIGYEKRMLKKEDFNNDRVDAGEVGAGHTVTALYEVVPTEAADLVRPAVDPLKYQAPTLERPVVKVVANLELLTLKIRYKATDGEVSTKLEFPLVDDGRNFAAASSEFKFAASVAGFGLLLQNSPYKGTATWDDVLGWAQNGLDNDPQGYRREFVDLVHRAQALAQ